MPEEAAQHCWGSHSACASAGMPKGLSVATVSWGGDQPQLMGTASWTQQDVAAAAELAVDLLVDHSVSSQEPARRRPCPVIQPGRSEWHSPVSGSPLLSL